MDAIAKPPWWDPGQLLREENTGRLLDLVVLLANLLVMGALGRAFIDLVRRADGGDESARTVLAGFVTALFVLQPAGAVLKRWHYHRRLGEGPHPDVLDGAGGCLFNPIFYFCLQVLVFCTAAAFLFQDMDLSSDDSAPVFLTVIFAGLVLMIASTVLVYRYFSRPARAPRYGWMRHPAAERLGDAFLFVHMLCFQVIWNFIGQMQAGTVSGVAELIGRVGLLAFLALLLYFPPRMLYLAEDLRRPYTWLWMLLANSPVIWRVVVGAG